jgi:hypothetical protein
LKAADCRPARNFRQLPELQTWYIALKTKRNSPFTSGGPSFELLGLASVERNHPIPRRAFELLVSAGVFLLSERRSRRSIAPCCTIATQYPENRDPVGTRFGILRLARSEEFSEAPLGAGDDLNENG